jgi:tetratricopeptide (TPR) repeat protein
LLLVAPFVYTALPGPAAIAAPLAPTCRAEWVDERVRWWRDDFSHLTSAEALTQIIRQLEQAQQRQDITLTRTTLDFIVTSLPQVVEPIAPSIAAHHPLAPETTVRAEQRRQLIAILDQMVALAQPLNSGYSQHKTQTLMAVGIAYQQVGQPQKAHQTLRLAAQAIVGIRGADISVPMYHRLAESWLAVNQFTAAATALNIAVEQTKSQMKAPAPRQESFLKLVHLYLQIDQPTPALAVLAQVPVTAFEPSVTVTQIAAAYAKNQDLLQARQLLDPLFNAARAIQDIDQREIRLMNLVTHYAPSGDFAKTQQIMTAMKRANSYRARAWLVIAGEARKFNQPTLRQQAIARLVADAKTAKIADQFSSRFDHEWYSEMSTLSSHRGYQPEINALVTAIRAVNALPLVLRDLIANQQFAAARQLVPRPMMVQVDAGYFDQTDDWLDAIALAEIKAGQPDEANARIDREKTNVERVLRFAQAFYAKGDRDATDRLLARADAIAQGISALPTALSSHAAIINVAIATQRPADAAIDRLAKLIATEPSVPRQAELLLALSPEFSGPGRSAYLALAERLGLLNQVDFATAAGDQAMTARNSAEASRFIGKAGRNPTEQLDFVLRGAELNLSQGNWVGARSLLDRLMQTLLHGPASAQPPLTDRSRLFFQIALNLARAGDAKRAIAVANDVTPPQVRDQVLQRLRCY